MVSFQLDVLRLQMYTFSSNWSADFESMIICIYVAKSTPYQESTLGDV